MATISDVAKEAGLAVATVSRIMNNRGYISEEARRKVEAAAEKKSIGQMSWLVHCQSRRIIRLELLCHILNTRILQNLLVISRKQLLTESIKYFFAIQEKNMKESRNIWICVLVTG